jgi:hypothetical protein
MPLSDILQREYHGAKLAPNALCELCYIANVSDTMIDRKVRSHYKRSNMRALQQMQLTGRMVWACNNLLHLLEGEFANIEAYYAILQADALHVDARQLILLPIQSRRFSDWAMYSVDIGNCQNTQSRLNALAELCRSNMTVGAVRALEIFLNPADTLNANSMG